jgi:flagellar assembly factor FliW
MRIDSTRWGPIEVPDDAVIHFPRGLYGLEHAHHFCLLQHNDGECFQWLQAADSPAIAMIVTNPLLHFPDYEVEIPDQAADLLQARSPEDVAVYSSVTVGPDRDRVYTNLLGPLVINHAARRGMQLILDGSCYKTQHLINSQTSTASRKEPAVTDQSR